jgi:hypothetical protein
MQWAFIGQPGGRGSRDTSATDLIRRPPRAGKRRYRKRLIKKKQKKK